MSGAHPAAAIRQALALLNRASADWRNGGSCESGPLHWPVAVNLARRELRQALERIQAPGCEASGPDISTEDTHAGMGWWHALQPAQRSYWLMVAESDRPADAWAAYKAWDGRLSRPAT